LSVWLVPVASQAQSQAMQKPAAAPVAASAPLATAIATAAAPHKAIACPPYADGSKADATPIVDAIDRNHDGKMTHREWAAARAPEPSWRMFMAKPEIKKQGYITREQFLAEAPPPGIDADCDGKITLAEFLATKKWKMGPGGPGGPK